MCKNGYGTLLTTGFALERVLKYMHVCMFMCTWGWRPEVNPVCVFLHYSPSYVLNVLGIRLCVCVCVR